MYDEQIKIREGFCLHGFLYIENHAKVTWFPLYNEIPPVIRGDICQYRIYQILKMPSVSSTDEIRIRTIQIGARYFITKVNRAFLLNFDESSTSSISDCGLSTYPTKMQVKKATNGIRTLLLIKSKKSRN